MSNRPPRRYDGPPPSHFQRQQQEPAQNDQPPSRYPSVSATATASSLSSSSSQLNPNAAVFVPRVQVLETSRETREQTGQTLTEQPQDQDRAQKRKAHNKKRETPRMEREQREQTQKEGQKAGRNYRRDNNRQQQRGERNQTEGQGIQNEYEDPSRSSDLPANDGQRPKFTAATRHNNSNRRGNYNRGHRQANQSAFEVSSTLAELRNSTAGNERLSPSTSSSFNTVSNRPNQLNQFMDRNQELRTNPRTNYSSRKYQAPRSDFRGENAALLRSMRTSTATSVTDDGEHDKPMRERLAHQLENSRYECPICYQKIAPKQAIWTCHTCYHMFHISTKCIVEWAKSSRCKEEDGKWRCPTCQSRYDDIPYNYYCFCGKERNPKNQYGETPHSCGNICGGKRAPNCPHPCTERCHPGPCPECPVMTTKKCNCGDVVKAIRCGSAINVKCEKTCDKLLECGVHKCAEVCHAGECEPCATLIVQECYCGRHTRSVACGENANYANPKYSCGEECDHMYACGKHSCTAKCHPPIGSADSVDSSPCGECPTSVNRIKYCPCGSKMLAEMGVDRQSCEDPIPTCNNVCNRVLLCGGAEAHRCREKCHTGPCPPCTLKTNVVCRCGNMHDTLNCQDYLKLEQEGGQVLCARRCKKRKSCGLHKCQEVCCVQEEHFCLQICNKKLSCGNHTCDMVCHPGQCPRCLNASFDEQFCRCGRTVRPPPVPCGAPLPDCQFPCSRHHPCGHQTTHKCHNEPNCPPCTHLTEKECYGGHEARAAIPCHLNGFSCGRTCALPLACGVHICSRACHNGPCVPPNEKCVRPCPVLRTKCEHPCAVPCHGTDPCPIEPCRQPVEVTCGCGRKKQNMPCAEVETNLAKQHASLVNEKIEEMQKKTVEQGPLPLRRAPSQEILNFMMCDEECKKVARNKKMADALGLATNDEGALLDDVLTITYSDYLKSILKQQPQFVAKLETTFQAMIEVFADPMNTSTTSTFSFPPMQLDKRRFIHEYAPYFHLETHSVDQPPKRSIIATAKRGVSIKPLVLLSDLPKYKGAMKTPGPVTLRGNVNEEIKKKATSAVQAAQQVSGLNPNEDGLRALKAERRMIVRRAAPVLEKPLPAATRNTFAVLDSESEDSESRSRSASGAAATDSQYRTPIVNQQKFDDWWSNEEMPVKTKIPGGGKKEEKIEGVKEDFAGLDIPKIKQEGQMFGVNSEQNGPDTWEERSGAESTVEVNAVVKTEPCSSETTEEKRGAGNFSNDEMSSRQESVKEAEQMSSEQVSDAEDAFNDTSKTEGTWEELVGEIEHLVRGENSQ